jgi:hypothetical protein
MKHGQKPPSERTATNSNTISREGSHRRSKSDPTEVGTITQPAIAIPLVETAKNAADPDMNDQPLFGNSGFMFFDRP